MKKPRGQESRGLCGNGFKAVLINCKVGFEYFPTILLQYLVGLFEFVVLDCVGRVVQYLFYFLHHCFDFGMVFVGFVKVFGLDTLFM